MGARPFAQLAAQSVEFKKAVNEVMNVETSKVLDDIFSDLTKMWESGGDNLSVS